jgi:hypothetical protein
MVLYAAPVTGLRDRGDAVALDRKIADEARMTGAVKQGPVADQDVVHAVIVAEPG